MQKDVEDSGRKWKVPWEYFYSDYTVDDYFLSQNVSMFGFE